MTNKNNTVLYIGVTSNLIQRVYQHKIKFFPHSFTSRYNCTKLIFFQEIQNIHDAILFEKKLKSGNRANKEKLIIGQNPEWNDLAEDWLFQI